MTKKTNTQEIVVYIKVVLESEKRIYIIYSEFCCFLPALMIQNLKVAQRRGCIYNNGGVYFIFIKWKGSEQA